ncbi:hypothetical protein BJX99DRAFT_260157 [Aspergillus californicus]
MPEDVRVPATEPAHNYGSVNAGGIPVPDVVYRLVVAFLAVAAYNTLVLFIWIFNTFKHWRGLYFWSILVATISVGANVIIAGLVCFTKTPLIVTHVGLALVQPCLVTAQIFVLYSRLYLITQGLDSLLRLIFWLIIFTSVVIFVPYTVALIGVGARNTRFVIPDIRIEHYAVIAAAARECILCMMYIYHALRQLKPILAAKGRSGRKVIIQLILATATVSGLDVLLAVATFGRWGEVWVGYNCACHSIKLMIELGVLNQLIDLLEAPLDTNIRFRVNEIQESQVGMLDARWRSTGGTSV